MKDPKVFTWLDALTYGLTALVLLIATILIVVFRLNADAPLWRQIGIWTVPAGGCFIYLRLLHLRWLAKKRWLESNTDV